MLVFLEFRVADHPSAGSPGVRIHGVTRSRGNVGVYYVQVTARETAVPWQISRLYVQLQLERQQSKPELGMVWVDMHLVIICTLAAAAASRSRRVG